MTGATFTVATESGATGTSS
jgi:hypothetical protein